MNELKLEPIVSLRHLMWPIVTKPTCTTPPRILDLVLITLSNFYQAPEILPPLDNDPESVYSQFYPYTPTFICILPVLSAYSQFYPHTPSFIHRLPALSAYSQLYPHTLSFIRILPALSAYSQLYPHAPSFIRVLLALSEYSQISSHTLSCDQVAAHMFRTR